MVKINCGIAGSQGATFSVEIDDSDTVEGLKEVISDKISASTKCDAMALIVFWGRKQDKSWVTAKEVTANAVDTSNLTRMHAAAPLSFFKLSEAVDVEDRLEVDQLVAGESPVGVLVEVPPRSQLYQMYRPVVEGVKLKDLHLRREALVEKLYSRVVKNCFVMLLAPSGCGKTSLLALFAYQHPEFCCNYIGLNDDSDPTQLLGALGIDIVKKECRIPEDSTLHIFMLDDCQRQYGNMRFWVDLLEDTLRLSARDSWPPRHIRFILSATYLLETQIPPNPVRLKGYVRSRLQQQDVLATDEEAHHLITMENGLPPSLRFPELVTVIIRECNGLVGALRASVDAIHARFGEVNRPQLHTLLGYYLSDDFVQDVESFFGVEHVVPSGNVQQFLIKLLFSNSLGRLSDADTKFLQGLTTTGIVTRKAVGVYEFCSPLAGRFYSKWLFPNRGDSSPDSLHGLIKDVIESLSAEMLRQSVPRAYSFPDEETLLCLFMTALTENTSQSCCICPELSSVFASALTQPDRSADGGIDLYLDGNLRWGIEVLVNGTNVGERLTQFAEKYAPLALNDYAVVDLRGSQHGTRTEAGRDAKIVTVLFEREDFSVAKCYFGTHKEERIQLAK